jgi:hypothetical protein
MLLQCCRDVFTAQLRSNARGADTENATRNTPYISAWRHSVREAFLCCVRTGHYLATALLPQFLLRTNTPPTLRRLIQYSLKILRNKLSKEVSGWRVCKFVRVEWEKERETEDVRRGRLTIGGRSWVSIRFCFFSNILSSTVSFYLHAKKLLNSFLCLSFPLRLSKLKTCSKFYLHESKTFLRGNTFIPP